MLKLDPKNTELLKQKQDILNSSIVATEDKLKQLQEIKEEADKKMAEGTKINEENYRALQREIINTQNKLNDLKTENSRWNKTGTYLTNLGNELDTISDKIEKVGNKLTTRLTLPITGALTVATKEAVEFESAFAGVTKTVDGTEEQIETLKQGIKDLSKEIPSTTTEIAAVAESAGQLGIETENILSFSKAMLDLGNSTNLTADDAASQLAKFANIMQMSQQDFDKLGSSIVDLGNNFATTESDIVDMAMRLAGAGKQVGLSEGQVLGLSTALSSVGIEAEMGGSAISKAMVKMQNAVELGGEKLNNVLNKTGMSLRDLELMSANDSMAFKELSQSLGMTSTEVKNLITAGTNLEDFAAVSGMTAQEFQKAWKEDAAGALSAFIQGLGDAENKGESAITMLSEMGLTEVRLRDSLLRAANAGDLFNDAIETGTEAWEENVALTNEANKRYETTESQLTISKNKIKDIAISLGDKLLPAVNKILDKVDKWTEKLDDLSDSQKDNIVKIGLMVAAAGPLLKVGSTAVSTIGKVSSGLGTMTKAIGVASGKMTSTETSVNNLANVFKATFSPTGLVVLGISAAVGIILKEYAEATEGTKKYAEACKESANKVLEEKKAIDELRSSIDANVQTDLNNIERTQNLWEELKKITDENGKIKKGYENRAKVITEDLSEALGTEISITDNVIDKYKELQNEIDVLILKKKGEAILSASEEKYNEALSNRDQKMQELIDKQEELNEAKKKEDELYDKYYLEDGEWKWGFEDSADYKNWQNQIKAVESLEEEVKTLQDTVNDYTSDIEDYQYKYKLFAEGTSDSIQQMVDDVGKSYVKNGETIEVGFLRQIQAQQYYLDRAKSLNSEAIRNNNETEVLKTRVTIDEANKRLYALTEELIGMTSTTEENSPEVIEAWKQLATNSYSVYYDEVSKLPEELSKKIQEMTGVTIERTPELVEETKNMSESVLKEFKQNEDFRTTAIDNLEGFLQGLEDEELRQLLKDAGLENVEKVINGIKEGNLAEDEGEKILESLNTGLSNTSWQNTLWDKARGIASTLSSLLTVKASVNGTTSDLPGHKSGLDYVPYDNYIARLHKGERVLTAEENKQLMQMEKASKLGVPNMKAIGESVADSIKTVFTTPTIVINAQDELTPNKINTIIDTVNRRLGSQY